MIRIVALGGTVKPGSTTARCLSLATAAARSAGAEVECFDGDYLTGLPHYGGPDHTAGEGAAMIEAIRTCDGLIVAAPGYHGAVSGLVKNALDYLEDLARDERPYLDGRAVGLIATAYGDQAATSTLLNLRSIIHALRGWPTPLGAAVRGHAALFDAAGVCMDTKVSEQLQLVGTQLVFGARALRPRAA